MDTASGVATLDTRGEASVKIPWRDPAELELTYQLTCIGAYAPVYVVEEPGRRAFRITGGREGITVSWTVRALRISADPQLPPRVRETLDELVTGASDKEIAARLGISPNTVHQYVKSLLRTFGAESRLQLVAMILAKCACGESRPHLATPLAGNG